MMKRRTRGAALVEYAFLLLCVTGLMGAGVKAIHARTARTAETASTSLSETGGTGGMSGGSPAGGSAGGGGSGPSAGSTGGGGGGPSTQGGTKPNPESKKKLPKKLEKKGPTEEPS